MNDTFDFSAIHANVAEIAARRRLSQKELCRMANVPFTSYWRIQHGSDPRLSTVKKLALALEVELSTLMRGA